MSSEDLKNTKDKELKEIETLMNNEKNLKVYKKLVYIRLKSLGYSTKEACNLSYTKKSTAYNTNEIWAKEGYNGLIPKKRKNNDGRKTKLTNEQLNELEKILKTKDAYDETDVQNIIKEKWSINYTKTGIKNLLKSQFNINIDNNKEQKRNNKNKIENMVNNYSNLKPKEINEINTIKEHLLKENDTFVNNKLTFLLLKKIGFSTERAAYFLDKTEATGNNWLKQWEKEGYDGLKRKPGQGRKSYLTDKQWDEVKKTKKTR